MTFTKKVLGSMTLLLICVFMAATSALGQLATRCNWGVGALAPTVWPASTQVVMMPVVMDFGGSSLGTSKVAFISFENTSQINQDGGGVLRIIDNHCNEIARFPDPNLPGVSIIPPGCPANILSHYLAPASGLAAGKIDGTSAATIVAVLDELTSNHKQLVGLRLFGGNLVPMWCSSPLPAGDFIPGTTAPAIAQLDGPNSSSSGLSEIIIDNKVYDHYGVLRYTGFSFGGNNCATSGGPPCPRSRVAVVANVLGTHMLPQVITGRGLYNSSVNLNNSLWSGTLAWSNSNINNASPPLVYPAVAEIVATSTGPEIVVTDTMQSTVRVLSSSNGTQLASAVLPGGGNCGGPPMIGDADGVSGPEIGVASCSRYTLFKYNSTTTLTQVWSMPISDPSGQTTSTLFNNATGRRIFYADAIKLWVFNGTNGNVLQTIPTSSSTAIEGPVIAALDNAPGARGVLILAANNYLSGCCKGVRIFDDIGSPLIGPAPSVWNQQSYHVTNVIDSFGTIPMIEAESWLSPAKNTYRVQQ
jgi:hypothetical protein